jgi:hypothetical protein
LEQALGIADSHPEGIIANEKRSDHAHSRRSRNSARWAFDDSRALFANTSLMTSRPAIFSESSFLTLSDFFILSVATHAFFNRMDDFFEIRAPDFAPSYVNGIRTRRELQE